MFDLNGDGNVDADEFEKVTDLMKQHSSTGNDLEYLMKENILSFPHSRSET